MSDQRGPRAQNANCRDDDATMSGQPIHGAILGVARSAANVNLGRRGCATAPPRYSSGPRTPVASRRSAHLVLQSGAKSANEVAQIINEKNNSLKEGVPGVIPGLNKNAKSY